jgi:hypothetical protein
MEPTSIVTYRVDISSPCQKLIVPLIIDARMVRKSITNVLMDSLLIFYSKDVYQLTVSDKMLSFERVY